MLGLAPASNRCSTASSCFHRIAIVSGVIRCMAVASFTPAPTQNVDTFDEKVKFKLWFQVFGMMYMNTRESNQGIKALSSQGWTIGP